MSTPLDKLPPREMARLEQMFRQAMYGYWGGQRERLLAMMRQEFGAETVRAMQDQMLAGAPGVEVAVAYDWDAEDALLAETLAPIVAGGLVMGMLSGLDALQQYGGGGGGQGGALALLAGDESVRLRTAVNWDLVNQEVVDYARTYTGTLAKGLNETTKRQLGEAIADWAATDEGLPGLTARLEKFIPTTLPDGKVIADRAELIASTEATRVFAEGNVAAWESQGVERHRWNTANDELVCPVCGALDGQVRRLDEPFDADGLQIMRPAAHPRCRCWTTPVVGDEGDDGT